jgi:solute carrier family 25 protein 42
MERMQCGALSGLVAQTITYPIEVTRRRMQTLGLVGTDTAFGNLGVVEGVAAKGPPTLASTVRTLYAEQGMRGFFKGVSMNWMKGPVAFSISFTAYDTVKAMMETEAEKSLRIPRLRKFSLRPPSAAPKA